MKYLLDTHALLWAVFEPDKLSPKAQEIILDRNNVICISLVSLWEISIKRNIGRLNIPAEFFTTVQKGGFELLPLTIAHIEEYQTLPLHHRDPFDRMLVIQTQQQQLTLITRDSEMSKYSVEIVEA